MNKIFEVKNFKVNGHTLAIHSDGDIYVRPKGKKTFKHICSIEDTESDLTYVRRVPNPYAVKLIELLSR